MSELNKRAYTEVIELLKFFPKSSIEKIPIKMLETIYNNRDKNYIYHVDTMKSFAEQEMLEETKAIFANIFRDYWATDNQKERIIAKEKYDRNKLEEEKREKYNVNDIFKNKNHLT